MGFLEKVGLGRKKSEGSPVIGEKKRQREQESTFKKSTLFKWFLLVTFFLLLVSILPKQDFTATYDYEVGEPWRQDDLTAPFTFSILKSEEEIEQEKKEIRENVAPIFHRDNSVNIEVQSALDSLYNQITPVLETYTEWQLKQLTDTTSASDDSLKYAQSKRRSAVGLSEEAWKPLLNNYYRFQIDTLTSTAEEKGMDNFIGRDIKDTLEDLNNELLNDGILNIKKETLDKNEITIRDLRNQTEKTYSLINIRDLKEAREFARFRLSRIYEDELSQAAYELFNLIIQPNIIYKPEQTQQKIEEAIANISSTKGAVAQGQVIVRRGDIVTREKYNRLRSLNKARADRATTLEKGLQQTGSALVILVVLSFFFMYIYLYRRHIFDNNWNLLLVMLATGFVLVLSALISNWDPVSVYVVPLAIAPVILTIIFDSRVGLMAAITISILSALSHGSSFEFITATFLASGLGVYTVRDIKNRSQFLFITPFIIFLTYGLVLTGFALTKVDAWSSLLSTLKFVGINALFMLFTYPIILIFEKIFNVTTDFTLLELSDTNNPLLKQLMSEAPGTFHHSLQVANLAESAASAIGANALLCRVAALYHDIGKMNRPEYFTENQSGRNAHDSLKPSMSASVIKEHVTKGVKMAEEHNIPDLIIDFIKTHHGTTVISYFYNKAKQIADKEDKEHEVLEEDFRYNGPIPQSRETGILLLADCIEASSRAMKQPNYNKLNTLIDNMVDKRIKEGQLNNTPLTFRDISSIKNAFLTNLVGIHHGRVEYPDDEEEQKSNQEAQKNETETEKQHQSQTDD